MFLAFFHGMCWCDWTSRTLARMLILYINFNGLLWLLETKYLSQIVHIIKPVIFGISITLSHRRCFFHRIRPRNFMTTGSCFRSNSMVLLERSFSTSWCEWWAYWNTTSQMRLMVFWTIFLKMAVFAAKMIIWTIWRYNSSALVNVSTASVCLALPSTRRLGKVMLILVVNCFDRLAMVLWLYETTYDLMVIDLVHFNLIKGPQNFNIFLKHLVFQNRGHGWRMVLLEAHDHVAH